MYVFISNLKTEGVHDICCGTILQYKMSAVELYMFISMYDDEQKN